MLGGWYQGWGNGHVNKWRAKAVELCVPLCRSPGSAAAGSSQSGANRSGERPWIVGKGPGTLA
jgi:hypothetical protein